MGFWYDLTARFPQEVSLDGLLAEWMRVIDKGLVARYELSPVSLLSQWSLSWLTSMLPRQEFTDLRGLLEKHFKFDELHSLVGPASPVLLIGAADVLRGDLKIFNFREGEICADAILASAAVPSLFPSVQIGERYYWDGLFSDNPPVKELIRPRFVGGENVPDEIWVIQINPKACKTVPSTPSEIIDRRNQMVGNISLFQSLEFVEIINIFLKEKALAEEVLNRLAYRSEIQSRSVSFRYRRRCKTVSITSASSAGNPLISEGSSRMARNKDLHSWRGSAYSRRSREFFLWSEDTTESISRKTRAIAVRNRGIIGL